MIKSNMVEKEVVKNHVVLVQEETGLEESEALSEIQKLAIQCLSTRLPDGSKSKPPTEAFKRLQFLCQTHMPDIFPED